LVGKDLYVARFLESQDEGQPVNATVFDRLRHSCFLSCPPLPSLCLGTEARLLTETPTPSPGLFTVIPTSREERGQSCEWRRPRPSVVWIRLRSNITGRDCRRGCGEERRKIRCQP
jgi:hypothetical protein